MIFIDNFLLFVFGACIGSFINLARFRIPKNQSILSPNSFCDNCKTSLNWDEKIPIISQLFLRKRCKTCNFKVPFKYSLIEILSGVLFIMSSQSTNFIFSSERILDIIIKCFFVSNLFLISLIDIDTLTIPNKLNILNYI